jgi:hypothetical protein
MPPIDLCLLTPNYLRALFKELLTKLKHLCLLHLISIYHSKLLLKPHFQQVFNLCGHYRHLEICKVLKMTQILLKLTLGLFDQQLVHLGPPGLVGFQVLLFSVISRQEFLNNLFPAETNLLHILELFETRTRLIPTLYLEQLKSCLPLELDEPGAHSHILPQAACVVVTP